MPKKVAKNTVPGNASILEAFNRKISKHTMIFPKILFVKEMLSMSPHFQKSTSLYKRMYFKFPDKDQFSLLVDE